MKKMEDYFELLSDYEKRDCVGVLGKIDFDKVIDCALSSHASEFTLSEFSTLRMLALERRKANALSNIEFMLSQYTHSES